MIHRPATGNDPTDGTLPERRPHLLDRRPAQIGEDELDARGIDGIGGLHAPPP